MNKKEVIEFGAEALNSITSFLYKFLCSVNLGCGVLNTSTQLSSSVAFGSDSLRFGTGFRTKFALRLWLALIKCSMPILQLQTSQGFLAGLHHIL